MRVIVAIILIVFSPAAAGITYAPPMLNYGYIDGAAGQGVSGEETGTISQSQGGFLLSDFIHLRGAIHDGKVEGRDRRRAMIAFGGQVGVGPLWDVHLRLGGVRSSFRDDVRGETAGAYAEIGTRFLINRLVEFSADLRYEGDFNRPLGAGAQITTNIWNDAGVFVRADYRGDQALISGGLRWYY